MIRIKELRTEMHKSLRDVANDLNISYSSLSKYERGDQQPSYETLIRIANYFNVTTDYLLGLSDMKRDLSGQIKMNETLDEYYDLIEVYRRMDGYDREMVWSIMQTVGKTAEKRKRGVGNDKSSDL